MSLPTRRIRIRLARGTLAAVLLTSAVACSMGGFNQPRPMFGAWTDSVRLPLIDSLVGTRTTRTVLVTACTTTKLEPGRVASPCDPLGDDAQFPDLLPEASVAHALVVYARDEGGDPLSLAAAQIDTITLSHSNEVLKQIVVPQSDSRDVYQFPLSGIIGQLNEADVVEVQIAPLKSAPHYFRVRTDIELQVCANKLPNSSGCDTPLSDNTNTSIPQLANRAVLSVRFLTSDSTRVRLNAAGFRKISINANTSPEPMVQPRPHELTGLVFERPLLASGHFAHGTLIDVSITRGSDTEHRYGSVSRSFEPYGRYGFWLPLGLLSTTFKRDDQGRLTLLPAPVSVALGVKKNVGRTSDSYIGISGLAGWQLLPVDSSSAGVVQLNGVVIGGIVDFFNVVYVGAGDVVSGSVGGLNPGAVWFLGLAPTVNRIFK